MLVARKDQVQNVKRVVEFLKREYRRHRETYWPQGRCDLGVNTGRFNVNRIKVKLGEVFELQMHYPAAPSTGSSFLALPK